MKKISIVVLILIVQISYAQVDTFSGIIPTTANNSLFEKVTTHADAYYFGSWNIDNNSASISIFKTNQNFELIESIENFQIRGTLTSYITFFEVVNDRLIMISSANINGVDRLYSHSLDLELEDHIIIDSLELIEGEEFVANEYKNLETNGNFYTIGNESINETRNVVSARYLEFRNDGHFEKFEKLKFFDANSALTITFDYNYDTKQYFIGEPYVSYLFDSTFNQISVLPASIPIQIGSSFFFPALSGNCNFASNEMVECISSGREATEYTNFLAQYGIVDDSLFYIDAIPLHPNENEDTRARLVHVNRDDQENYYFSYHGPFTPQDGVATPNSVFISKFDSNLNEIYFIELENNNEYIISESTLDENNNLIIVGSITTADSPERFQNFYIKVSENGEVLTNTFSPISENGIEIYPNPCADELKIDIVEPGSFTYSIYSLDGRMIKQGIAEGASIASINTSNIPSGMYALHIHNGNNVFIEKFVKR